jgi:hypothetical protein
MLTSSPVVSYPLRVSRVVLCALLGLTLPFFSGCLGVGLAVGAAGLVGLGPERDRIRGEIDGTLSVDYPLVVASTADVLAELQFTDIKRTEDTKASKTEFSARTLQGRSITVGVNKEGANLTKVKVHMEIFGDRDTSNVVLGKIKKKVEAPAGD